MSHRRTQQHTPDIDNPTWTKKDIVQAQPAREVLASIFSPASTDALLTPRGRPKADATKVRVGIRLSPEVLDHFKASGDGWQTRIDAALRQFIAEHPGTR